MNDKNESEIKRFLDIKAVNGQSQQTIINYRRLLNQFVNFLGEKAFEETTEQDVMAFLAYKKKSVNDVTMEAFKIALKSFYRFLYGLKRGEYPQQVANIKCGSFSKRRSPIRPEDVITKDDIAFLVRHCRSLRDQAILVALYESGCRISEFANLNIGHLLFDEKGLVMLVDGKTGERRIRLIESVPFIEAWLQNHPLKDDKNAPLWVTLRRSYRNGDVKHSRLSTAEVARMLQFLKECTGFSKPINPHAFRHSRLTELAKFLSDGKLKVFAGWGGSSSMASVYVHLGGRDLDDDLLQIAGVETTQERKVSPLKAKECTRCHARNAGTNEFCCVCGKPFNDALIIEQTMEQQELQEELKVLRNEVKKTEGVEQYLDALQSQIEELHKELDELRNCRTPL